MNSKTFTAKRIGPIAAAAALAVLGSGSALAADAPGLALARQNACMACHGVANKIVGPGFTEIAARYKGKADAKATLVTKVKAGGSGNWGAVPMPPQAQVKQQDLETIVGWILDGAK